VASAAFFHTDTSIREPNPAKEKKSEWAAVIELPLAILPQPPLSANLVSIFSHADQRVHISAVPLPGQLPNFHQPAAFEAISLPQPLQVGPQWTAVNSRLMSDVPHLRVRYSYMK
jgi:hypothetical protein